MSKYSTITTRIQKLCECGLIAIVEKKESRRDVDGDHLGIIHTLNYWIVPKKITYSIHNLRRWMSSLFPGVKPDEKRGFSEDNLFFHFARLEYTEVIATQIDHRMVILNKNGADWQSSPGFVKGKMTSVYRQKLKRYIYIHLYPDSELARCAMAGDFEETDDYYARLRPKDEVEKKRKMLNQ